jgi:hypothetical protein
VFHRAYDAGAAEVSQVVGAMTALQKLATPPGFLLVGDSKLVSYTNLSAMSEAGVTFLAPGSKTYVPATVLATLDLATATEVGYVAERDTNTPPEKRGRWRVLEDTMTMPGKRKRDPVLHLRRVFVHSTARAQAAVTSRAKKLDRARDDLERPGRGLGSRHYPDAATSRPASPRSAGSAKSGSTCVPRWVPTRKPGNPRWPGTTTNTPWPPTPPPTAGTPCSPTCPRDHRCRGATPLQTPRNRRTPLQRGQRPPRRRTDVPQQQPAYRSADQRDLPGTAHLLPHRTPGTNRDRPTPPSTGSTPADPRNPPADSSSKPSPRSASSPPPQASHQESRSRNHSKPTCSTSSVSTPPNHHDQIAHHLDDHHKLIKSHVRNTRLA